MYSINWKKEKMILKNDIKWEEMRVVMPFAWYKTAGIKSSGSPKKKPILQLVESTVTTGDPVPPVDSIEFCRSSGSSGS